MPYFVELIVPPRGIRNNKDQEAKYIAACLEEIKQELRQYNLSVKVVILWRNCGFGRDSGWISCTLYGQANAVAKLNYLQMLGYDISWAGFNIIEVSSCCYYTRRRVL